MSISIALIALASGLGAAPAPQQKEVVVEVRVLALMPDEAAKVRAISDMKDRASAPLSNDSTKAVMNVVESAEPGSVMCCPRMRTYDGQELTLQVGDEHRIVSSLDVGLVEGRMVCKPRHEQVFIGYKLICKPTIVNDGRSVRLDLDSNLSSRVASPKRTPFTYLASTDAGEAVPVTQWIEEQGVDVQKLKAALDIPDSGTAILAGGTRTVQTSTTRPVPVLSKLPNVGKLFNVSKVAHEQQELFLVVTTRIVKD